MSRIQHTHAGTQVLRRVSEILQFVALNRITGARLVDIAEALQLQRPTAHRLLQGLVAERMLTRNEKRYGLGPNLCELSLIAGTHFALLEFFKPAIGRVVDTTGDTVVLTVRSGNNGVVVERRSGAYPLQANSVPLGTRRPLVAGTGGLAILSGLSAGEARNAIAHNIAQLAQNRPGSQAELVARVEKARAAGFVVHKMLNTQPAITAVGVPVFGSYGAPIAGLSVRTLANRFDAKRRNQVALILQAEAAAISRALREESGMQQK